MRRLWRKSRWRYRERLWERTLWFFATRLDWLIGALVAYGYRPTRALWQFATLWLLCSLVFAWAAERGIMAPTDPKLYLSENIPAECRLDWANFTGPRLPSNSDYAHAKSADEQTKWIETIDADYNSRVSWAKKLGNKGHLDLSWKGICKRAVPSEYSEFQPLVYALDIILPLLDLRQENDWAPRTANQNGEVITPLFSLSEHVPILGGAWGAGHLIRLWEWIAIAYGWTLTILVGASVSGLIAHD